MAERKVVLVTGSGKRRLGRYVAEAFGVRGYALAIHYRTSAADADAAVADFTARGIPAAAFGADLTDELPTRALVSNVHDRWGRIDVLVNCASIWHSKRLEDVTAADVRAHFEANVLAAFVCSQATGLAMAAQPDGGCIVNFGDWAEARPY